MPNWFNQYLKLNEQLTELINAEQGDSDEADLIRDQMDDPWHRMTNAERIKVADELTKRG